MVINLNRSDVSGANSLGPKDAQLILEDVCQVDCLRQDLYQLSLFPLTVSCLDVLLGQTAPLFTFRRGLGALLGGY